MEHRGRGHIEKAMGALVQNIKKFRDQWRDMRHGRDIHGIGEGIVYGVLW